METVRMPLDFSIDWEFFTTRTKIALRESGITTINQLKAMKQQLLQINRFGKLSLEEVNKYLNEWDF